VVPAKFGYMNLAGGLSALALPFDHVPDDDPIIDLTQSEFCDPAATVTLAAFAATYVRTSGRAVELQGWDPGGYLSRVGLKKVAGHKDDFPRKRLDSDRLTSLMEVRTADERQDARTDVLNVLDVHHQPTRDVLSYCLEEM